MVAGGCNPTFFDTFDVESGRSRVLLADQRLLITKTIIDEKGATVRAVCAEPSPDAVTVFGASLAAAGALASGESVGVSAGYQEAAASIGLRSASITLIRDIAYRACEARMNGVFDDDDYRTILSGTPAVMLGVFAIDGLTQIGAAPAARVEAFAPKADTSTPITSKGKSEKKHSGCRCTGGDEAFGHGASPTGRRLAGRRGDGKRGGRCRPACTDPYTGSRIARHAVLGPHRKERCRDR